MNESFLKDIQAKGYVQAPDGSWSRPRRNLGALGAPERESDKVETLERSDAPRETGKGSLGIRVEIVSFRKRLVDDDNLQGGCKPLRDAIARSLGVDDGDPCFTWEYSQQLTKGEPGTLVKITVKSSDKALKGDLRCQRCV